MRFSPVWKVCLPAAAASLLGLACEPIVEAESARADATPTESDALVERFRDALAARDVDAALALVHLDGALSREASERAYRAEFARVFERPVARVTISPPVDGTALGYSRGPTRFRPNLAIVASLSIEFAGDGVGDAAGPASTSFPLGRSRDGLRIATAIPVR